MTLWRWLDRAVAQGMVCRDGGGHKTSPYRYWLAAQEQRWLKENPDYVWQRLREENDKQFDALRKARFAEE